jgi:hypothetical protein
MENGSENAVEEGTNLPVTRPLDEEDLDHTASDDASTNSSSKRPRVEEKNCNQESIEDEPQPTKRSKIEDKPAVTEEKSSGVENQVNGDSESMNVSTEEKPQGDEVEVIKPASLLSAFSPVLTRSRATDKTTEKEESGGEATSPDDEEIIPCTPSSESGAVAADNNDSTSRIHSGRWRGEKSIWMVEKDVRFVFKLCWLIMLYLVKVHQMVEDYVDFVGKVMYPATKLRPYGFDPDKRAYPIEGISVLGYLKSPLRRPTVMERWSPYEIALFEAALLHHGKEFQTVGKEIGSKSTKEVIDFYYVWKKTGHYKKWKDQFVPDSDLLDVEAPPVKGSKP